MKIKKFINFKIYESTSLKESEMVSIIGSIVDEEVGISREKFGLELDSDVIQLEKKVLSDAIILIWNDIENSNNREYEELMNFIFSGIEKSLPFKELHDSGKKDYKVHISCTIYKIFMVISNKLYNDYLKKYN
jgi:hypothetical protein